MWREWTGCCGGVNMEQPRFGRRVNIVDFLIRLDDVESGLSVRVEWRRVEDG